jgi:hypothetical protein
MTFPLKIPGFLKTKIPRDGLIAEWLLSSNGNDTSGNSYNFTAFGGISFVTPEANAANMDLDKYLKASDQDDFTFSNGSNDLPFSLSFKFDGVPESGTNIWFLNKRDTSSLTDQAEWQLVYFSGEFYLGLIDKNTGAILAASTSSYPLTAGTEHHIVYTYDGSGSISGMKIYIDNVSQSLSDQSSGSYTTMRNTTSEINCCKFGWADGSFLDGYIKLMRMYNRVLSVSEINALYSE